MRIVGGSAGGRTLKGPKDATVIRPTADRVRQTIFNVLGQRCDGQRVLDLYSGTGAFALEALSRGAASAVLVDSGREAQALCVANAAALGMPIELLKTSAEHAIATLAGRRFDLIFADPPYAAKAVEAILAALSKTPLLEPGGRLVLEHGKHEPAPEAAGLFTRLDERPFGETRVTIFGLTASGA